MNTTPPPSSAPAGDEHAPRPKFSRRPASFARAAPSTPLVDRRAPAATPAATNPAHSLPIAWQEDARFGIVMLLLVVLLNVALVYGLPLLPNGDGSTGPLQVLPKASNMPVPVGSASPQVTLYSQPEEERRTIYLLNLRNAAAEQNTLSVSPQDTPPPTAQPLDHEGDESGNQ